MAKYGFLVELTVLLSVILGGVVELKSLNDVAELKPSCDVAELKSDVDALFEVSHSF